MMLATFAGAEGRALPGYVDPDCEMIVDLQGQHRASFGTSNIAFESMQGLIDLVQKGFFPAGSKVLYAHLGGAPALNGYGYTFRNG